MKKIEDLGEMDVIHCPTFEDWEAILKLNPRNDVPYSAWDFYKKETCYRLKSHDGTGSYARFDYFTSIAYTIHQAIEFLPAKAEKGLEIADPESQVIEPKLLKDTDLGYFTGCLLAGGINPQLAVSHAKNVIEELRKEVSNA